MHAQGQVSFSCLDPCGGQQARPKPTEMLGISETKREHTRRFSQSYWCTTPRSNAFRGGCIRDCTTTTYIMFYISYFSLSKVNLITYTCSTRTLAAFLALFYLLPAATSYYQLLPAVASYYPLLPATASYCQLLPATTRHHEVA